MIAFVWLFVWTGQSACKNFERHAREVYFCSPTVLNSTSQNSHILIMSLLVRMLWYINFLHVDSWTGRQSKRRILIGSRSGSNFSIQTAKMNSSWINIGIFFHNSWRKINSVLFDRNRFVFVNVWRTISVKCSQNWHEKCLSLSHTHSSSIDCEDESIYQQIKKSHYNKYLNEPCCIMFSLCWRIIGWDFFCRFMVDKLDLKKRKGQKEQDQYSSIQTSH